MLKISTVRELESAVSSVQHSDFTGDIECGGDVVKEVRAFFSQYQRSNERGRIKTGGGLVALGFAAATVATGGMAAVALAAAAAVGLALDSDTDRKATKRMPLGDLCYELAQSGYKMKQNRHDQVLLSRS